MVKEAAGWSGLIDLPTRPPALFVCPPRPLCPCPDRISSFYDTAAEIRKVKVLTELERSQSAALYPNSSPRTSRRPRPRYHPRICDRPPARPTVEGGSIQHHCDCPQSTMSAYAEALGNTYLARDMVHLHGVSCFLCRARPPPYNLLLTVRGTVTLHFVRLRASRMTPRG